MDKENVVTYTQWHITQPLKELIFIISNINRTGNHDARKINHIQKDKGYKFSLIYRNYKINLVEEPSAFGHPNC